MDFLDKLNKAVEKEVSISQEECPVFTIDSSIKDFASDESVKTEMVSLIQDYMENVLKRSTWKA